METQHEQDDIFATIRNDDSSYICIQDNVNEPSRFFLKEWIRFANADKWEIHVFCFDCNSDRVREELATGEDSVHFYDCLPPLSADFNADGKDELEKFLSSMSNNGFRYDTATTLIIIDSLSTMFLQKSHPVVYQILRNLVKKRNTMRLQVLGVFHEDTVLAPKQILTQLKRLCPIWIRTNGRRVTVAVRKETGKVTVETYKYDSGKQWHKEENVDTPSRLESDDGPVSSFKLTLSETEKKARDAVKLPYERYDDNEPDSSAAIIYEPDEFDDWDEEDPDNDLEFS